MLLGDECLGGWECGSWGLPWEGVSILDWTVLSVGAWESLESLLRKTGVFALPDYSTNLELTKIRLDDNLIFWLWLWGMLSLSSAEREREQCWQEKDSLEAAICAKASLERPAQPRWSRVLHWPWQNTELCPLALKDWSLIISSQVRQTCLEFNDHLEACFWPGGTETSCLFSFHRRVWLQITAVLTVSVVQGLPSSLEDESMYATTKFNAVKNLTLAWRLRDTIDRAH